MTSHTTWTKARFAETISSIRSGARLIGVKGSSWLPDGVLQDAVEAIVAKLDEKPTVDITDTPANGEVLTYDSASGKYKPSTSGSAPVSSVFTRTGAVVAASGDYTASQVTNTPAGGIAATTVQAALNELDTEKPPTTRAINTTAPLGGGGDLSADRTLTLDNMLNLSTTEVSVTGAITLTSTAFGKLHVCSGTSADYTVGLPAASGNAGKIIAFRMSAALTKLVTIDANAAETIDGALTRVMWAQETAILLCDGSGWTKIAGKSRPMTARIWRSAAYNLVYNTVTALPFDAVDEDIGSLADTANNRILIRRAGRYRTMARIAGTVALGAGITVPRFFINSTYLQDERGQMAGSIPSLAGYGEGSFAAASGITLGYYHSKSDTTTIALSVTNAQQNYLQAAEIIDW